MSGQHYFVADFTFKVFLNITNVTYSLAGYYECSNYHGGDPPLYGFELVVAGM